MKIIFTLSLETSDNIQTNASQYMVIVLFVLFYMHETLAFGILLPMLLDLGGARVGVLSCLFEDRE